MTTRAVSPGRVVCAASALLVGLITPGAAVPRIVTILALALALGCFLLRKSHRWVCAARTEQLIGSTVALAVGGALANLVAALVPSSVVPVAVLVLAPVALWWLGRSFQRAAAVIDQTTQEFAVPPTYEPRTRSSRPDPVPTGRPALHS